MSESFDNEELEKQVNEIMEIAYCYNGIEDEVLKLICLFGKCLSSCNQNGEDMLSRKYILEKTTRLLLGIPIILDAEAMRMFVSLKMDQKAGKK